MLKVIMNLRILISKQMCLVYYDITMWIKIFKQGLKINCKLYLTWFCKLLCRKYFLSLLGKLADLRNEVEIMK